MGTLGPGLVEGGNYRARVRGTNSHGQGPESEWFVVTLPSVSVSPSSTCSIWPVLLYILYCTYCTVHTVLYILYCTYCTVHTVLYILYCTYCTVHMYSTVCTVQYVQYSMYS